MHREPIFGILREHEPELRAAGHVFGYILFGSAASVNNTPSPSVALFLRFDRSA